MRNNGFRVLLILSALAGSIVLALPGAAAQRQPIAPAPALSSPCDPPAVATLPQGNFRYATAQDALTIPNANVGDYILDGWNTGGDTIYISTAPNFNNSFALGPGKKILIKGGAYKTIRLDIPNVAGSAANPVIITNYGGQVATRSFTVIGARSFVLSGRYAPAEQTGDPNFRGWETDKPYYQGQFGFDFRNGWVNTSGSGLNIGGNASAYEIEYVEAGDGGFAGMLLETDSGSVDMVDVSIHENYIHDSDGEGIYLGSTQSDPQHQFRNLHIYDNVIARAGLNTLQVGQLAENVVIEHNVLIMGAINWKNPFGLYQDEAVQFGLRRGGTTFRNNIVIGGGKMLLIGFLSPKSGLPLDANSPLTVEDNLFLGGRSPSAVYLESRGDNVTPAIFRNNYVGRMGGVAYLVVYPNYATSSATAWAAYNGLTPPMTASGNRYDATVMSPFIQARGSARLTASDNAAATVALPRFVNFMGLPATFDYTTIEKWNRAIGEASGFPAAGTTKGQAITYALGALVMHKGELYRSKQNNNHDHQPQDASDAWWELVTFPSTGGACIPDDLRLYSDDFYAERRIGLTRVAAATAGDQRLYLPLTRR